MNGLSENFSINKKRRNLIKIFFGAIVFLFLIFVLNFAGPWIKNSVYILSLPIENIFWSAGESSSGYVGSIFKAGFLSEENENLKDENKKLLLQVAALQAVIGANTAQSDVSLACQNNNFETIMAGVVGLDEQDILSINKGQDDGIAENMPVINQQGVVFGKVYKVYKNFSKVMLISSKNSVVNVKIQRSQDASPETPEIEAVVKGSGELGVFLDLVPINSEIKRGDILLTSSIEKTFPKDHLVGIISQVQKNDQKPFQQAKVEPYFNIKTADNLFVITNYKQN